MVPPHNRSIKQLAREEGISEATLFNWRSKAREKGLLPPDAICSRAWTGVFGNVHWNGVLPKGITVLYVETKIK